MYNVHLAEVPQNSTQFFFIFSFVCIFVKILIMNFVISYKSTMIINYHDTIDDDKPPHLCVESC